LKACAPTRAARRRHEAILRLIVDEPRLTLTKIAAATEYSQWQVSRIINSPDFRERHERMRKIIEQELARRYMERFL